MCNPWGLKAKLQRVDLAVYRVMTAFGYLPDVTAFELKAKAVDMLMRANYGQAGYFERRAIVRSCVNAASNFAMACAHPSRFNRAVFNAL